MKKKGDVVHVYGPKPSVRTMQGTNRGVEGVICDSRHWPFRKFDRGH